MSNIAIITARGGSKRIPGKNIRDFCGKPIIVYSIEAALESGVFDEVMVSTDSREIAEIAKKYGAAVPFFRSANASSDYATTADVLREVLEDYRKQGRSFDIMGCLYPTAPFITAEKLQKAVSMLEGSDLDSIMPVVQFSFPPQRGMVIRQGELAYQYPENAMRRSQDLEPVYHDCGQFYFCKVAAFEKYKTVVTPHTGAVIMPEEEVQDIDNYSDWMLAEMKYRIFMTNRNKD